MVYGFKDYHQQEYNGKQVSMSDESKWNEDKLTHESFLWST